MATYPAKKPVDKNEKHSSFACFSQLLSLLSPFPLLHYLPHLFLYMCIDACSCIHIYIYVRSLGSLQVASRSATGIFCLQPLGARNTLISLPPNTSFPFFSFHLFSLQTSFFSMLLWFLPFSASASPLLSLEECHSNSRAPQHHHSTSRVVSMENIIF